jgi:hypothetical protein
MCYQPLEPPPDPEQSTGSSPPEKANITYALRYSEAPPDVVDVVVEDPWIVRCNL